MDRRDDDGHTLLIPWGFGSPGPFNVSSTDILTARGRITKRHPDRSPDRRKIQFPP
jgi:hypothetical protein